MDGRHAARVGHTRGRSTRQVTRVGTISRGIFPRFGSGANLPSFVGRPKLFSTVLCSTGTQNQNITPSVVSSLCSKFKKFAIRPFNWKSFLSVCG